jgi:hypothetical protein
MSWTPTRNMSPTFSPPPPWPKSIACEEFIAWNRGLLKHPAKLISRHCLTATPGVDASAIHGRLGARVALLQSPILPPAVSPYSNKDILRNPVDKPHTCNPWSEFFAACEQLRLLQCEGTSEGGDINECVGPQNGAVVRMHENARSEEHSPSRGDEPK